MVTGVTGNVLQNIPKPQEKNKTAETESVQQVNNRNRVDIIREQIENGTYEINTRKTAEKMALNLLG